MAEEHLQVCPHCGKVVKVTVAIEAAGEEQPAEVAAAKELTVPPVTAEVAGAESEQLATEPTSEAWAVVEVEAPAKETLAEAVTGEERACEAGEKEAAELATPA